MPWRIVSSGRCGAMGDRLPCCVPFCRRTIRSDAGYSQWMCGKHWSLAPLSARSEYNALKRQARKIVANKPTHREWWKYPGGSPDRLEAVGMWRDLDAAWQRARDAAIERAAGL